MIRETKKEPAGSFEIEIKFLSKYEMGLGVKK
jgi:hypothetical protein